VCQLKIQAPTYIQSRFKIALHDLVTVCHTYSTILQAICVKLAVFVTYSEYVCCLYDWHIYNMYFTIYAGCVSDIHGICISMWMWKINITCILSRMFKMQVACRHAEFHVQSLKCNKRRDRGTEIYTRLICGMFELRLLGILYWYT